MQTDPLPTRRGTGFDDQHREFFKVEVTFRVPGFLATSFKKEKSLEFLTRAGAGQSRCLWRIQVCVLPLCRIAGIWNARTRSSKYLHIRTHGRTFDHSSNLRIYLVRSYSALTSPTPPHAFQVDPRGQTQMQHRVKHVAVITQTHVEGECEYLFAPCTCRDMVFKAVWKMHSYIHKNRIRRILCRGLARDYHFIGWTHAVLEWLFLHALWCSLDLDSFRHLCARADSVFTVKSVQWGDGDEVCQCEYYSPRIDPYRNLRYRPKIPSLFNPCAHNTWPQVQLYTKLIPSMYFQVEPSHTR